MRFVTDMTIIGGNTIRTTGTSFYSAGIQSAGKRRLKRTGPRVKNVFKGQTFEQHKGTSKQKCIFQTDSCVDIPSVCHNYKISKYVTYCLMQEILAFHNVIKVELHITLDF